MSSKQQPILLIGGVVVAVAAVVTLVHLGGKKKKETSESTSRELGLSAVPEKPRSIETPALAKFEDKAKEKISSAIEAAKGAIDPAKLAKVEKKAQQKLEAAVAKAEDQKAVPVDPEIAATANALKKEQKPPKGTPVKSNVSVTETLLQTADREEESSEGSAVVVEKHLPEDEAAPADSAVNLSSETFETAPQESSRSANANGDKTAPAVDLNMSIDTTGAEDDNASEDAQNENTPNSAARKPKNRRRRGRGKGRGRDGASVASAEGGAPPKPEAKATAPSSAATAATPEPAAVTATTQDGNSGPPVADVAAVLKNKGKKKTHHTGPASKAAAAAMKELEGATKTDAVKTKKRRSKTNKAKN